MSNDSLREQDRFLTYSKVGKMILKRSFIVSFANFIGNASGFIGIYLLSNHDQRLVSASSLISSTETLLMLTSSSSLLSLSSLLPEKYSTKHDGDIAALIQSSCFLSTILAIPTCILMMASGPILEGLGQSTENSFIAQEYLQFYSLAVLPNFFIYAYTQFLMSTNREMYLIPLNISALSIETALSYLLIPPLGVKGLAIARAIQSWINLIGLTLVFKFKNSFSEYQLFKPSWTKATLKKIAKMGLPISLYTFTQLITEFVQTIIIGREGDNKLAILQAGAQYAYLFTPLVYGLSQINCNLINEAYGLQAENSARKIAKTGLIFGLGISAIPAIGLLAAPHQLASVFLSSTETINEDDDALLRNFFIYLAVAEVLDVIREMSTSSLRGVKDVTLSAIINIVSTLAIILPLSFIFSYLESYSLTGIGIAQVAGLSVGSAVLACFWNNKKFDDVDMVEQENEPYVPYAQENSCWGRAINFFTRKSSYTQVQDVDLGNSFCQRLNISGRYNINR